MILQPGQADAASLHDVFVMLAHEGRERTETEWKHLLCTAGFQLERITSTMTPYWLIEARAREIDEVRQG